MDDLLYEPRALWGIKTIDTADAPVSNQATFRVLMDRPDFINGSRYPIELTHLNIAAINYTFRAIDAPVTGNPTFRNDESVLSLLDIFIRAPKRMSFSPYDVTAITLQREPTNNPGMRYSQVGSYPSDIFGVTRWTFDRPYLLGRGGDIQFQLGCWTRPAEVNLGINTGFPNPTFSLAFFEEGYKDGGGRLGGDCRVKERTALLYGDPGNNNQFPAGPLVAVPDAFGATGNAGASSASGFPVSHDFTPLEFTRQETARGSIGSLVSGYAVHINQIDFDETMQTSNIAWVPGTPITPMSMRVGTRAKTRQGGTNEWWWRPGCPLALVSPTITPALVHKLPEPITLGPGEGLEIELQVPGPFTDTEVSPPLLLEPVYTFGVSFTGYAIVEG